MLTDEMDKEARFNRVGLSCDDLEARLGGGAHLTEHALGIKHHGHCKSGCISSVPESDRFSGMFHFKRCVIKRVVEPANTTFLAGACKFRYFQLF